MNKQYLGTSHLLPGGGGGRLYSGGGVGIFLGDVLGGGENKNPLGQGGSYISSGIWGVRCVPLVFAFIKSQSFWGGGQAPQTPHIPNDTANNIKYSK